MFFLSSQSLFGITSVLSLIHSSYIDRFSKVLHRLVRTVSVSCERIYVQRIGVFFIVCLSSSRYYLLTLLHINIVSSTYCYVFLSSQSFVSITSVLGLFSIFCKIDRQSLDDSSTVFIRFCIV